MLVAFINGHGGVNPSTGQYVTSGKRSPIWEDGRQLFEGVSNRSIVLKIMELCCYNQIECINLVPEWQDISLGERVRRVNKLYVERKDLIVIEIHSNAGGGTGFEVFTTVGNTKSDLVAEIMIPEYQKMVPELKLRSDMSDGDLDKEINFYTIRKTKAPHVLFELAFMDTWEPDCRMLMEEEDRFVDAIFEGIKALSKDFK